MPICGKEFDVLRKSPEGKKDEDDIYDSVDRMLAKCPERLIDPKVIEFLCDTNHRVEAVLSTLPKTK